MTAFDTAFNLIKFDFHFAPNARHKGHHYAADHNKTRPSEYTQNKEYDRKPRMEGVGQQNAAHYRKGSREWVDLSTAIDKPAIPPSTQSDKGTYHRGESTPRLNDDGSYTGINLSALDFTDDENWDENVEEMAAIGAHETVHRVQNDDITEWAKQQTGYKDPPEGEEFDFDRWVAGPTEEEKQQENNYRTLRSIGHEFGAYSATPDSSQPSGFMSPEKRKQMMSGPVYRGREYSMGNKPFSDLRQKSEPMTAFDTAWNLMVKSDDEPFEDDDYPDNEVFDNPVARVIDQLSMGLGADMLECFSCGHTGETTDFVGWHKGRGRKCPNCGSYEVHDPEGPAVGDNYQHKDETPEEEAARRNAYYERIHWENNERKPPEGGQ